MTEEQRLALAEMPDGYKGWAMVRVVTDGGSLRLYPDGSLLAPQQVRTVEFDPAHSEPHTQ